MSKKFISVRTKKIRTLGDAANFTRHGKREKGSFAKSKVDLERTYLNMHFAWDQDVEGLDEVAACPDYGKALEDRRKAVGAKGTKNGAVGTEMMFTCSPEVLRGPDGQIDLDKSRQWARDCIELAEQKYPGMCVAARVDLDETTPHASVFILPTYEKTYGGEKRKSTRKPKRGVSHNKVFGGRADHSLMQDWLADGLVKKGWNVERGIPVEITRAKNFRPDGQMYQLLKDWWMKLKKREADVKKRENHAAGMYGIIRDMSQGLDKHREYLTGPMKRALDWVKSTPEIGLSADDPAVPASRAGLDPRAAEEEGETLQSPAPPAPRF